MLGSYYLTYEREEANDPALTYGEMGEVLEALARGEIDLRSRVWVRGSRRTVTRT